MTLNKFALIYSVKKSCSPIILSDKKVNCVKKTFYFCKSIMNLLASLFVMLICFFLMLGCSSGRPFSIDDDDDIGLMNIV